MVRCAHRGTQAVSHSRGGTAGPITPPKRSTAQITLSGGGETPSARFGTCTIRAWHKAVSATVSR
eukprot:5261331-Prymnesium_polylepis.1